MMGDEGKPRKVDHMPSDQLGDATKLPNAELTPAKSGALKTAALTVVLFV